MPPAMDKNLLRGIASRAFTLNTSVWTRQKTRVIRKSMAIKMQELLPICDKIAK